MIVLSGGPFGGEEVDRDPVNGDIVEMAGSDEYGNTTVYQYRVDVHPKSGQVFVVYIGEKELLSGGRHRRCDH